jgi:hypothetical protein
MQDSWETARSKTFVGAMLKFLIPRQPKYNSSNTKLFFDTIFSIIIQDE